MEVGPNKPISENSFINPLHNRPVETKRQPHQLPVVEDKQINIDFSSRAPQILKELIEGADIRFELINELKDKLDKSVIWPPPEITVRIAALLGMNLVESSPNNSETSPTPEG